MSISYVFYSAEDRRPHEIIDEINRELGSGTFLPASGAVAATEVMPHLWVAASTITPPVDSYVQEDHGFFPRTRVHLRLDKNALNAAQDELLDVVTLLLRRSPLDAVLLREEENVALSRKEGRLELSQDALWADPERRQRIERLQRRRGTSFV